MSDWSLGIHPGGFDMASHAPQGLGGRHAGPNRLAVVIQRTRRSNVMGALRQRNSVARLSRISGTGRGRRLHGRVAPLGRRARRSPKSPSSTSLFQVGSSCRRGRSAPVHPGSAEETFATGSGLEDCVGPLRLGTLIVHPKRHVTAVADVSHGSGIVTRRRESEQRHRPTTAPCPISRL